ncbi:hypothetical protein ACIQ6R_34680 [Streptomyces sp. NPDC096048]
MLEPFGIGAAEWDDWYGHRRLHGEIGHIPAIECETSHYLATANPESTV